MRRFRVFLSLALSTLGALTVLLAHSQQSNEKATSAQIGASPEMTRLAQHLAGDWDTTETMEASSFFAKGGSRHGRSHVRLTAGGTTLLDEVSSDGSAGKLDGFLLMWWDKSAGLYRFFACFNNPEHPCQDRGTAHWEEDIFVNDYFEVVNGKKTKFRDSFVRISPTERSLVAAIDTGDGTMKTLITTKSTRR